MADWKQITARIRRARTGKDPAAQLSNLYQKTRDAMVAFELARHFETAGQSSEAVKWYATAAERFRRSDWKTKAQQAAARLGGSAEPAVPSDEQVSEAPVVPLITIPEPAEPFAQTAAAFEAVTTSDVAAGPASAPSQRADPVNKALDQPTRRRRGRRGGRNHRRGSRQPSVASFGPEGKTSTIHPRPSPPPDEEAPESRPTRAAESPSRAVAETPSESTAPVRARLGDPGLSSRLSLLEMQFRRLWNCPPLKLDEAERAPAGPGVLLLSDSELTTHYYVENCQTLRIAVANLLRGNANRRASTPIKPKLAEHLGIAESRVSKYLAEHCVVRYLQLDEDSSYFAHFVIAVLRPVLND